jgi:hypothetical protein
LQSASVKNKNAVRDEGYQIARRIVKHEELMQIMIFSYMNVNENNGQAMRETAREESDQEQVS